MINFLLKHVRPVSPEEKRRLEAERAELRRTLHGEAERLRALGIQYRSQLVDEMIRKPGQT